MIAMEALVEISDSIGTFRKGQMFYVMDEEYSKILLGQGRAKLYEVPTKTKPKVWDKIAWPGATVVIFGSGPSLDEAQVECVRLWREAPVTGRRVIALNTTFRLAPWADVIYGCDSRWWDLYYEEVLATCSGEFWSQDQGGIPRDKLNLIQSNRGQGLSTVPGTINQGMNSGYQAISLAYLAGAHRMILLGFDMRNDGKKTHWHGDHPDPLRNNNPYKRWIENFGPLATDLQAAKVEVVNATPKSALPYFLPQTLAEALA